MSDSRVLSLPEELISPILQFAASHSLTALLATCHTFNRICTPFRYQHVHIDTSRTASLLTSNLVARPELAVHVRDLECACSAGDIVPVLRAIGSAGGCLDVLDFTLDAAWPLGAEDFSPQMVKGERDVGVGKEVGEALCTIRDVRCLVLRKRKAYLSLERLQLVLDYLARGVEKWRSLESATITYRLSAPSFDPAPGLATHHGSPTLSLPLALSRAPSLRTFCTALPAVWNPAILTISANPALQRIVFTIPRVHARPAEASDAQVALNDSDASTALVWEDHVVPGVEILKWGEGSNAQLWMRQAWKYPRLVELIGAVKESDVAASADLLRPA